MTSRNDLAATASAALTAAEQQAGRMRELLDQLNAEAAEAARALPEDPTCRVVRRYTDKHGRKMVELEIELPDDLVRYLDTLPDPSAFVERAIWSAMFREPMGRHLYGKHLRAVAETAGLTVGWGEDLDLWHQHYPAPPDRLSARIVKEHRAWLAARGLTPAQP